MFDLVGFTLHGDNEVSNNDVVSRVVGSFQFNCDWSVLERSALLRPVARTRLEKRQVTFLVNYIRIAFLESET